MNTVATTKMSSKGEIVISEGDVVVLKTISPPSIDKFEKIVMQAREAVLKSGIKPENISEAIKAERLDKANCS